MHVDIYSDNTANVRYINGGHACFNIYNIMIECFKEKNGNCKDLIQKWDTCIRKVEESKTNLTK